MIGAVLQALADAGARARQQTTQGGPLLGYGPERPKHGQRYNDVRVLRCPTGGFYVADCSCFPNWLCPPGRTEEEAEQHLQAHLQETAAEETAA